MNHFSEILGKEAGMLHKETVRFSESFRKFLERKLAPTMNCEKNIFIKYIAILDGNTNKRYFKAQVVPYFLNVA